MRTWSRFLLVATTRLPAFHAVLAVSAPLPLLAPVKHQTLFTVGLLLDSRVVDLPLSYNPIVVTLSSLKPFFFNGLKKALPFSDNVGASDPGIQ